MAYPTGFTTVVDGVTEIVAAHINNLEAKVGIDIDPNPLSLDYRVAYLESNAALLPGRAGGQTLDGGTGASENLTLQSTAHATKGRIECLDDFKADKHAAFGGSGAISSLRVVDVAESVVPTGNNQAYRGISSALTVTPSGDFTGIWIGLRSDLTIAGAGNYVGGPTTAHNLLTTTYSGTGSLDYTFGLTTRSTKSGGGAIAIVLGGAQASFSTSGGGTTAVAQAFRVQGGPVGDAITDAYGIYVRDIKIDGGGGSITNLYGLYLEPQTEATTLNYNLYSAGATTKNYFGGSVGIGTASPDTAFHVVGSIKMVDGAQGLGKVMVSDTNGVGAWVAPGLIPAGGWTDDGTIVRLTTSTDRVSIGTATPWAASKFEVKDVSDTYIVGSYSAARTAGYGVQFFAMDSVPQLIGKIKFSNDNGTTNASTCIIGVGNGSGGGTDAITIKSTGYVGIGTATPTKNLDVETSSATNIRVARTGNAAMRVSASLTGSIIVDTAHSLQFGTDSIARMTIKETTGNVLLLNSDGTTGIELRAGGSGLNNTFVGYNAGKLNTTGNRNTFIGKDAGPACVAGLANTYIGYNSGVGATGNQCNTFVGDNTGTANAADNNTFIGFKAGYVNSSGTDNVFVGKGSGLAVTTGGGNTFVGSTSGQTLTDGTFNTFVGKGAGTASLHGIANSFFGYSAGGASTGDYNTYIGYSAGITNTSGASNVFLGFKAGYYETGSNKLFIDNTQRASEADARAKALVYGVFDAAIANQIFTVNAKLNVNGNLIAPTIYGSEASGGTLTIKASTHATQGDISIGNWGSTYPSLTIGGTSVGGTVAVGDTPWYGAAFTVSTKSGQFSGGDWLVHFRHEGTAASNESLIRHEHFSNFSGTAAVPQPVFTGIANRGTFTASVGIGADDYLLVLDGRGYDGSSTSDTSAQIAFRSGEAWSGTAHGSYMVFRTTPLAGTTPQERMRIDDSGNVGIGATAFGANAVRVLGIYNGTAPSAAVANEIQIYSSDTGDATATLSLMLEQAVEAIGTFTASHKIKVRINGTLYWLQLDAV